MYSAVDLATVKKNSCDKMTDYLKSLGRLLQYSIKQTPWNYRVFPSNFLWGKENFLPLGLLLLMYVCRQLDNKPAKIPIEVTSFIWSFTLDKSQGEHSLFSKEINAKKSTFTKSCGEHRAASWKSFVLVAIGD